MAALVGGGRTARPGEVSLAHRGVLLLDELPEFVRPALEALRQPIEDGTVAVARAEGRAVYPARFQLVATMNLCPCGARGDPAQECSCSPQRLASYRDRLSRALLDRFDLVVTVPRPRATELAAGPSEPSGVVAERVAGARERLQAAAPRRTTEADALLSQAVERLPLSGRGRARVARVARSAAALGGAEAVLPEHVAEALGYRSPRELEVT
jgi:magnesium chelatase family protein